MYTSFHKWVQNLPRMCAVLVLFSCTAVLEPELDPGPFPPPVEESPEAEAEVPISEEPQETWPAINGLRVSANTVVKTYGWADMLAGGMKYANAATITLIDDTSHPIALTKRQAFTTALASDLPKIVVIEGDIDLSDGLINDTDKSAYEKFDATSHKRLQPDIVFPLGSNTTLLSLKGARLLFGGLKIVGKSNIIIRNIEFWDAYGATEYNTAIPAYQDSKASLDALSIEGSSQGIWIDHCTFSDGASIDLIRNYNHDGTLDIKQGVFITISYNKFTNHDKVTLIGSSDTYTNQSERRITFHHNYYYGVTQRLPRSRGAELHLYNNVYDNIGVAGNSGYALGPGIGSQYIVEANYFGTRLGSIVKYFDKTTSTDASTFSKFYHRANFPELGPGTTSYDSSTDYFKNFTIHEATNPPWAIEYDYTLDDAVNLKSTLGSQTGMGKIELEF